MKDKSTLVTGGAGFVGSHLVDHLVQAGWFVKVVDNLSSGKVDNLKCHKGNCINLVIGDLKDQQTALKAIEDVEVVFHYAADPEVRVSATHPAIHFEENIVTTFNLLEAIRQGGNVKNIVFASSSAVYGDPVENPVKEISLQKPISVYGASKLACEALLASYSTLYGFSSAALRYANIIGPRLRHGIIYDFVKKLEQDSNKLEILGDGTQMRSYLHVTDAVKATYLIYSEMSKDFDTFNVGNEDWIKVDEVANLVIHVMGKRRVKFFHKPVLNGRGWLGDVKHVLLDVSKLKGLGWKPSMNSKKAVKSTVHSLLKEL